MQVKYAIEDLGLILLCSLPPSYTNFWDTILYNRDTLIVEEVYEAICLKEQLNNSLMGLRQWLMSLLLEEDPMKKALETMKETNQSLEGISSLASIAREKGHVLENCYKL